MTLALTVRKPGFRIGPSFSARFSPNGELLATIGLRVVVWDVENRQRLRSAHPFSHPHSIDFSPDSTRLAVKNTSGEVLVLEADTLDVLARHDGRPYGEGSEVIFSPCGEYLVDGSWNGDLLVREGHSGQVVWHEHVEHTMVERVTCTPDRQTWVTSRSGSLVDPSLEVTVTIRRWPFTRRHQTLQAGPRDTRPMIDAVALDPSGSRLAILTYRTLNVWDLKATSQYVPVSIAQRDRLRISGTGRALAWHPSGERLALAGAGTVELLTAKLRRSWATDLEYACNVEFSPSGALLALGAWSKGAVIETPT